MQLGRWDVRVGLFSSLLPYLSQGVGGTLAPSVRLTRRRNSSTPKPTGGARYQRTNTLPSYPPPFFPLPPFLSSFDFQTTVVKPAAPQLTAIRPH